MISWNDFWSQLFSPLNNFVSIALIVFITMLVNKLVSSMEDEEFLEIIKFKNQFFNNLFSFVLRFILSFFMVLLIVLLIIILISLFLGLVGFILQYL